jgi:hypothetical protein
MTILRNQQGGAFEGEGGDYMRRARLGLVSVLLTLVLAVAVAGCAGRGAVSLRPGLGDRPGRGFDAEPFDGTAFDVPRLPQKAPARDRGH